MHVYQNRAVDFLKSALPIGNKALWADMGLGKTVCALTAFRDLICTFDARRALVVAPLRVARRVWSAEVEQWAHLKGLKVVFIGGTAAERIAALNTPADIHTIGRENCMWLEQQFIVNKKQIRPWKWDTLILDESQSFKSISAQRFRVIRKLRKLCQRVWELTGTCAPNGYADLHSQIFLLDNGQRLGATQLDFRKRWFTPPGFYEFSKWAIKDDARESIHAALKDIVFTLRAEDYLDLPPVVFNAVKVTLDKPTMKRYKQMERDALLKFEELDITVKAVNAGVLWNKLLQMANGAVYTGAADREFSPTHAAWMDETHPTVKPWQLIHDAKLDALEEVLDGIHGPVMIAYNFVSDLERISRWMDDRVMRWAQLKSDKSFDAWRNGEIDYGLIHPASAGHGLNDLYKSGCTNIIWFGFTNNLEHYQQLNARLTGGHRRVGKTIVIHHLIAEDTIDTEAAALLGSKDRDQRGLVAALAHYSQKAA